MRRLLSAIVIATLSLGLLRPLAAQDVASGYLPFITSIDPTTGYLGLYKKYGRSAKLRMSSNGRVEKTRFFYFRATAVS